MARFVQPAEVHGISFEQAKALAMNGIDTIPADALIRRRVPDEKLVLTEDDLADTVRVVCFVDSRPWTHERPLAPGEEAIVPRKVAELMARRHQVTIIQE